MDCDNCVVTQKKDTNFTPCISVNSKEVRDLNGEEDKEEEQEEGRGGRKSQMGLRWHK